MKLPRIVTILMLLAIVGVVVSAPNAYADPIAVGDLITFQDGPGAFPGGEFIAYHGSYHFPTFCVEGQEYIMMGVPFEVVGISDRAIYGSQPPDGDPLNPETAYLYQSFRYGTLSNFAYDNGARENFSATQLQIAIWAFEAEEGYTAANVLARMGDPNYTQAALWIQEAKNAGWVDIGNVRVLNMEWTKDIGYGIKAQDQLVLVPEPGILILLGIALSTVGLAARRYRLIP
jgi:hypothetical protein